MNTPDMRERCAAGLLAAQDRVKQIKAFIGFDGFVDLILDVVDKRESVTRHQRVPNILKLAERVVSAAGRSTNLELVVKLVKLGGNGPIMANALATFGVQTAYLGTLGYPNLHPVFAEFAQRAEVHSVAEPGFTDALEFEDGKILLGKHESLKQMNWENICGRFGLDEFTARVNAAQLLGFVNWTMLTAMNEIWAAIQSQVCPTLTGPRRTLFIDLADPEKRTPADIRAALELIVKFERHFHVILGLNQKEACEIGRALDLETGDQSPEGLTRLGLEIQRLLPISSLVIHPTHCALAFSNGQTCLVEGPFTSKPHITTGAGDHFNSGFCLGKLIGFDDALSLLTGVATSGHYVRTAQSPTLADLAALLRNWPQS